MVFECLRCGNCCRHPGDVRLQDDEIERVAALLGLDAHAFTERYTRLREDRRGLILSERGDGACIFLEDPGAVCRIQAAKPRQCRDFPARWRYADLAAVCPASVTKAANDGSSPSVRV